MHSILLGISLEAITGCSRDSRKKLWQMWQTQW